MTERIRPLDDVVPGIFPGADQAEAAIAKLRVLGFSDDEMGVIVSDKGRRWLLDDAQHEALKGLGEGMLFGIPAGVLGGIALAAIAAPGLGVIGIGGALLFGGPVGGLWGAILGGYLGMTAEVHHLEDIEEKYEVPLADSEVLVVVVTDGDRADEVCAIMQEHGARCARERVTKTAAA